MRQSTLEIRNIVKMYWDVLGVGPVSFSVDKGEFLALLGPSGCGKTTTLRIIAGLEVPTEGTVFMDAEEVTRKPVHKRGVGFVFQSYALFPHFKVKENVAFGLRFRNVGKGEMDRRVDEALEIVNLQGLGERYPSQLSGGQQQRVALARAIVIQPGLLLLDEPLSNIDTGLRLRMQIELKRIQQQIGITTLYVTHDQTEAFTLADRVALFNKGKLVQIGAPEQIYESPANRFVAEFIGESNFLEGNLISGAKGWVFRLGNGVELALGSNSVEKYFLEFKDGAFLTIRPQRVKFEGLDDLGEENVFHGVIAQMINKGDVFRFMIESESIAPSGGARGSSAGKTLIVANKYNTQRSRLMRAGEKIRFQLPPGDLKAVAK
jgi:ABC-type Fe3+/spermidine/putrescine transport system ATPase subunit